MFSAGEGDSCVSSKLTCLPASLHGVIIQNNIIGVRKVLSSPRFPSFNSQLLLRKLRLSKVINPVKRTESQRTYLDDYENIFPVLFFTTSVTVYFLAFSICYD